MAQKTVKLDTGEEVEDRAVEGSVIERNWHISSTPALHSEEPYDFALMVEEYIGGKKVKYAIYKGTVSECCREHHRLSKLRYEEQRPYMQCGNGTPRITTLEEDLQNVKIAQESINRTIKTIHHKSTNEYTEMLDEELGRHKANLSHVGRKIAEIINKL